MRSRRGRGGGGQRVDRGILTGSKFITLHTLTCAGNGDWPPAGPRPGPFPRAAVVAQACGSMSIAGGAVATKTPSSSLVLRTSHATRRDTKQDEKTPSHPPSDVSGALQLCVCVCVCARARVLCGCGFNHESI